MSCPCLTRSGAGDSRGRSRHDRGSALVLFGVVLSVLIGVSALVMDMGRVFVQKLRTQTAADSAALAAGYAMAVAEDDAQPDITAIATEFAIENGAETVDVAQIDWENQSLEITVSRQVTSIFAQILGIQSFRVSATGRAGVFGVGGTSNLVPIIVQDSQNQTNGWVESETTVTIWDDAPDGAGNFGWLDWDGGANSAGELADTLSDPSLSGTWEIGDEVEGLTGVNAASAVRRALDDWIGRHFTVPLYDSTSGEGANLMYHISGFAEFKLLDFSLTSHPKQLTGLFIKHVKLESYPGGGDSKLRTVILTD